jgi:hypothetical protein
MKRSYVLFGLIFVASFSLFSQQSCIKQDSIPWNKNYRLKWSDFKGKPDTLSKEDAACAASIYVKGFRDKGLPNFLVYNSFMKNDAWTRDSTSVMLLQHEQLHFDIAEVYARKIRKAVDSLRRKQIKTINSYSVEITKLLSMFEMTGKLYDEQTSHGIYGNQQSEWRQKILKELEALNDYKTKPQSSVK